MAGGGTSIAQSEKESPSMARPWGASAPQAGGDWPPPWWVNGRGSPQHHTGWGATARGTGHIMGRRARALQDCMGLAMGCTEEEAKVGKRTDRGGLERNKHGKTEGQGVKRSWLVPLSGCALRWNCAGSPLSVPSAYWTALVTLFPGEGLSILRACGSNGGQTAGNGVRGASNRSKSTCSHERASSQTSWWVGWAGWELCAGSEAPGGGGSQRDQGSRRWGCRSTKRPICICVCTCVCARARTRVHTRTHRNEETGDQLLDT